MNKDTTSVCILFGGKSAEHEVSVRSARSIFRALDPARYEVSSIGINHAGRWLYQPGSEMLRSDSSSRKEKVLQQGEPVVLVADEKGAAQLIGLKGGAILGRAQVVFPVLHGPFGEDGTVQGLLEMMGVPYVGCGVLASSACMDKEFTKRLLVQARIPTPRFVSVKAGSFPLYHDVRAELGAQVFVKPANLGSSVGISRADSEESLQKALQLAFQYDSKVLIEEQIIGRELECSVLGNENPQASLPGEIVAHPKHGFYSYEAKYLDDGGAVLKLPAEVSREDCQALKAMAVRAFQALGCEGMARVDFFLREKPGASPELLVNELNTIPGFTSISMYPKLWEISGIPFPNLVERLVSLALARHARQKALRVTAW
jgi:D-alanine-D-alanine ligase